MTSKAIPLTSYFNNASSMAFGCMGLGGGWDKKPITAADRQVAHRAIETALASGINVFDHADIYTLGKAEQVFGELLAKAPQLRSKMLIQSKCGIRFQDDDGPGRYDFSKQWIRESVENSLRRLQIEQLDLLLLHRPDPLIEVEEVACVVQEMIRSGKVKHLGVSNMHHHQIALLQSALESPIVVNQLELNLANLDWLDVGIAVGQQVASPINFPAGTLEYCQSNNIQIQSWGCLAQGRFSGKDLTNAAPKVKNTANLVSKLAQRYEVSPEAIVLSWLMRHPCGIQPVIGTTNQHRIAACAEAMHIRLTREDWYGLYVAARGTPLP